MSIVNTITKNVLRREWADIEPKLYVWLVSGGATAAVAGAAEVAGYPLNAAGSVAVATAIGFLVAYLKSSTAKVAPVLPVVVVPPVVAPVATVPTV